MIDSCECGDVERCTLCRFRQTYMSAADAWQAGLAMAKECESLQSQLTQARAELERERGWRKALASTAMCEAYCATSAGPGRECDCGMEHVFEEIQAAERDTPTINEVSTREELIDE